METEDSGDIPLSKPPVEQLGIMKLGIFIYFLEVGAKGLHSNEQTSLSAFSVAFDLHICRTYPSWAVRMFHCSFYLMQLCVTELLIRFPLGFKEEPIPQMPSMLRWSNALRREGLSFLKSLCNK